MIADGLIAKGIIEYYQGQYDKALESLKESLALFEEMNHVQNIARALNALGGVFFGKGELDQSITFYEKSLVIKKKIGNKQEIAITLNNLGGTLHKKGVMRLATAADEILPQKDPRVQQNPAYLVIILLSRVVTKLGDLTSVTNKTIESLFSSDLTFLQDFYQRIKSKLNPATIPTKCIAKLSLRI